MLEPARGRRRAFGARHSAVRSLPLLLLVIASCATPSSGTAASPRGAEVGEAPALRVMSFNLRFDTEEDGEHAWPHRRDRVASVIRFHAPDLVGVQEALESQLDDLEAALPGYTWFGEGREGGRAGEHAAILYRKERVELLEEGTFWLSETPDEVSVGWDARHRRVVTWGRMRDRASGRLLVHLNTHFDHVGKEARRQSARLLSRRAGAIAGEAPVVVTGDFNAEPSSEVYAIMTGALRDARAVAQQAHHGPDGTFGGFVAAPEPLPRIDYIFVGEGVRVRKHAALAEVWEGRYASDHVPLVADVLVRARPAEGGGRAD